MLALGSPVTRLDGGLGMYCQGPRLSAMRVAARALFLIFLIYGTYGVQRADHLMKAGAALDVLATMLMRSPASNVTVRLVLLHATLAPVIVHHGSSGLPMSVSFFRIQNLQALFGP